MNNEQLYFELLNDEQKKQLGEKLFKKISERINKIKVADIDKLIKEEVSDTLNNAYLADEINWGKIGDSLTGLILKSINK